MKAKSRSIVILSVLFGYILLQFLWWEILLVRQNGRIINEKQKLIELTSSNEQQLREELMILHHKKNMQTVMIVSEGTVFLLLLLFGIYKIKQSYDKESLLNNQQKNFFLSITHELKTPIAATKLQLQTLQKQKLDEVTRQELISNALVETERLNLLIDNVLLASRLETEEFIFKKERTNLGLFITTILTRYYKDDLAAGHLSHELCPDVFADIDTTAFPSVITNLVDNALKYSVEQKEVKVQLTKVKKGLLLHVSDRGCGISNIDKPKIFSRFYRAGNEETRQTKGTGLGLYIVHYIIKKHAASLSVKDHEGGGSVFEIELNAA